MISHSELLALAKLSKLYIPEEKMDTLSKDMNSIIDFANEINSVNVENNDFDNISGIENAFRNDEVIKSLDKEEILKNAKDCDDGCFVVKKRA